MLVSNNNLINNFNLLNNNFKNSFNKPTVESLAKELKEYNETNDIGDKDYQFIDILEKAKFSQSSMNKIRSGDGQELLEQISKEIDKIKGKEVYEFNSESENNPQTEEMLKKILQLRKEYENEKNPKLKQELLSEIMILEAEMFKMKLENIK